MSRRLVLSVILLSVILGALIGYVRGVPEDFVEEEVAAVDDYGYRCGDGSEFTLIPSEDMSTIKIVPATSVDYIRETTLHSATNDAGTHYTGSGITLRVSGTSLVLSTVSNGTTMCASMRPTESSLFYLGD